MNSIMVSKNAVDYLIEGVIENNEIKIHDSVGQIYAELFEKNIKRELFEKTVIDFADYLCRLRTNNSQKVVVQMENYVKTNYSKNISLKEMSRKFYVNSAYLGQIFRKTYGISFREYLNKCRIDKASELLIKTDDMVYEIAETVGYNDADYFVNKFIAMKGCSPTTYRKRTRAYN